MLKIKDYWVQKTSIHNINGPSRFKQKCWNTSCVWTNIPHDPSVSCEAIHAERVTKWCNGLFHIHINYILPVLQKSHIWFSVNIKSAHWIYNWIQTRWANLNQLTFKTETICVVMVKLGQSAKLAGWTVLNTAQESLTLLNSYHQSSTLPNS